MKGMTLDAGALIAFERGNREAILNVRKASRNRYVLAVPAGAVAQVWRDGRRQARLAWLLQSDVVEIVPLDARAARMVGGLCGVSKTSDVVDASVVLCARERGHKVLTSDPKDLARIDPNLDLVRI